MDEISDEEDAAGLSGVSALGLPDVPDETRDMSVSTLHLYDLHLSQVKILQLYVNYVTESPPELRARKIKGGRELS